MTDITTFRWPPRPPADEVDDRLKRWCVWPGCDDWYDIHTGPHEHGWVGRFEDMCPTHAKTGHFPTQRGLILIPRRGRYRGVSVAAPTCHGCDWEDMPRQTGGEVTEAWRVHAKLTEVSNP